jgi:Ca-activated chloride channel family protein
MNWGDRNLLHLLWCLPLLWAFFIWAGRTRKRALKRLLAPEMIEKLVTSASPFRRRLQAGLFLAAIAFFCLAAARPQWGTKLETITRRGIDVVVAIDTSLSMEANDVVPNRLDKAKHMLQSLIDQLQGDRIGVVAFAGTAFVQCPLTLDHGAARMFLDILNTRVIPAPGTDIGAAIRAAIKAFNQKEKKYKALVLLTDGEDHQGDWKTAAEEARDAGVQVYCIGIGTSSGQPIPMHDEQGTTSGYKKDENGEVVVSRLDENTLQEIAGTTGGKYYFATAGESEVDDLRQEIGHLDKRELESKVVRNYQERFQYFLAAGLILLMAEMLLRKS